MLTIVSAQSDLGLINPPINTDEYNWGVEKGPQVILDSFELQGPKIIKVFPKAANVDPTNYKTIIEKEYGDFAKTIIENHNRENKLLTLGGDHSVSYCSLKAILEIYKEKNVGIIMFDSHADIHTWDTSPSNNFHGIWLRAVIEEMHFDPSNLLYVGNLNIEDEEREYLEQNGVKNINRKQYISNQDGFIQEINDFIAKYDQMHFSFDVDMLDNSEFSATGCYINNGFTRREVVNIFDKINRETLQSLDLVEFNPDRSDNLTVDLDFIYRVIATLLEIPD